MTLIKRYAIEPAALRRWEDFRYVMEKMSFSDGKVLVAFPKKWIKDFLDGLGQIGDIERQRFVTKLQRYKEDRMIESGSPYFKKLQWVDNALRVIKENKVEAVLVSELTKTKNSTLREALKYVPIPPRLLRRPYFSVPESQFDRFMAPFWPS